MKSSYPAQPFSNQALRRADLLSLVNISLSVGETRYARRLSLAWLSYFPGDLAVSLLHAQSFLQERQPRQALPLLEILCGADPEFVAAQKMLLRTRQALNLPFDEVHAIYAALGGRPLPKSILPKWALATREARAILERSPQIAGSKNGEEITPPLLEKAEQLIHQALTENPATPMAAITHLKIEIARPDFPKLAVRDLAQAYHERWPDCIYFTLILADALMDSGIADQSVALLHQAVTQDIAGQVAARLWAPHHPYRALWPEKLEIGPDAASRPQEIPIPASVAVALGWNQLPAYSTQTAPATIETKDPVKAAVAPPAPVEIPMAQIVEIPAAQTITVPASTGRKSQPLSHYVPPETLISVQEDLERIAEKLKQPALAHMDGRFPIYVIMTTRSGLTKKYGKENFASIDQELRLLVEAVASRKHWNALLFYADDPEMAPARPSFQLRPAVATDPWELKLALVDLDAALGHQGEMIGSVLIVGGPEVVPFHKLPNPVDDSDVEIPSDNPYATRDENYFIPEWPVGRLPGGNGDNPKFLLQSLNRMVNYHTSQAAPPAWYRTAWRNIAKAIRRIWPFQENILPGVGYSAAIWQRASLSVFRKVGEPHHLFISPPLQVNTNGDHAYSGNGKNKLDRLPAAHLGYFNLHGLPDAVEWYGQRDPTEPGEEPDFPMALRPEDIGNSNGHPGSVPEVVFSEACYGANIPSNPAELAISLKFLSSGSRAFIGSTTTSYGSISTPLIAADLLGRAFWHLLGEGHPAGEALRRAKISLAREMHRRQGYLDGEDQKTLISFICYGDPLAQTEYNRLGPKSVLRPTKLPAPVSTVCDKAAGSSTSEAIPEEVLSQVKRLVAEYLPGMKEASISYCHEHAGCTSREHACPTAQMGNKSIPTHLPDRQVITLSKQIRQKSHLHQQYARLTLDAQGKLVKLVMSR
jgi:hypothetical protein